MNYFPFHIGDYAVHTRHLSLMEDLAYRRLLDLYYTREGDIPALPAEVARLLGMREHEIEVASVLAEFFNPVEGKWTSKRADEEICKMRAKQENARASVAKRASVTQVPRERDASVIEASTTNNQEPVTKKEITPPPPTGVAPLMPKATKRCPADFLVTTELQQWARERAALVDIRAETGIFRDTEFAKAHTDWSATWRAWMAKEQRRHAESAKRDSRRSNVTDLETPKMRAERIRAEEISPLSARRKPTEDGPVQPFVTTIDMEPAYARLERD